MPRQQCPNIPVSKSATRAKAIEHRWLSPWFRFGVRPYGCGLQMPRQGHLAGLVRVRIGQKRESLDDVVVKLSANPGTFLLLCLNQLAAHVCERGFGQFALGDVDKRDHCSDNLLPSPLRIRPIFNRETCSVCPPKHLVLRVDSFPGLCYPVNCDTPLRGTTFHPHDCDATDHAYSCRALDQCARIPKCGGRQGCRRCIGVRDQFRKWLQRWSQEEVGVCLRSHVGPHRREAVLPSPLVYLRPAVARARHSHVRRSPPPMTNPILKAPRRTRPTEQHLRM